MQRKHLLRLGRRLNGSQNPLWRAIRSEVLSSLVWAAASILAGMSRVRIAGASNLGRVLAHGGITACWHSKTLFPVYILQRQRMLAVISRSRDGEIQARVFERFGWELIRGSSGGGGASVIRSAAKAVRKGGAMGITPDGPMGPRERVQQGVAAIAALCDQGVVPVGVGCSRHHRMSTWDRYMIPTPGSRVVVLFDDPILPGDDGVEGLRVRIERGIAAAEAKAERLAADLLPPADR
ncbi:MAG: hypothetical protein COW34_11730 [Armatimonadetes bacterium CG17_big_fil_post_rev_8_21_14_2_50_66_6]|nr:MAG: hypothetical protein COW34_11730 [Armatimonadetes bacterium CG17_big_fil_post_rev_8_21_14_2_50_66_6]